MCKHTTDKYYHIFINTTWHLVSPSTYHYYYTGLDIIYYKHYYNLPGKLQTKLNNNYKMCVDLHGHGKFVVVFITWQAQSPGKMNHILCCDWLRKWARWGYLARSGLPAMSRKKNFLENHMINPLLTKLVGSRWLDWPHSVLASLRTLTQSPWQNNHAKKRTWSISSHPDLTFGQ